MSELLENIKNGFRLSFLRSVSLWDFHFGKWQATWLFLLLVLFLVIAGYLKTGVGAQVDIYAIPGFFLELALYLSGYFLIAQFLGYKNNGRYIVVVLAASLSVAFVLTVAEMLFKSSHFVSIFRDATKVAGWTTIVIFAVIIVWVITVMMITMRVAFKTRWLKALFFSAGFMLAIWAVLLLLPLHKQLFWPPEDSGDVALASKKIDTEQVYYAQSLLMEAAIAKIEQGVSGVPDLFLITFASYGRQDVFKREVEFVTRKVEERYQNRDKTLGLLNHPISLDSIPLANAPNLQFAISAVGEKMRVDEDILMVYMTSHGSKEAELSASLWPIQPNPVNAVDLRKMLDQAEIKWRIIIVSACFSGSFIEFLKNPDTLIITASSAQNTSFGCSNDRELTYFAEALFDQAWEKTRSIVESFEIAREWVTKKEKEEGKTPSEPQLYVGENIESYLRQIKLLQ